jgi:tripartite ATP-independent transporter DctP family solute receptor
MKRFYVCIAFVFSILFIASSVFAGGSIEGEGAKKEQIVLRFGHLAPAENTQGRAVQMMADLVLEKTNGEVRIDVFPNNQLGSSEEQQEMLRLGTLDLNMASMDYWSPLEPTWAITGWAFAFKSNEHLENYSKSEAYKKAAERLARDYNMTAITMNWVRGPYKVLLFKKPVRTLADFQGLRHRLPEVEMQIKNWEALGARATPVNFSEVFLAMKQGIVDSMDLPFDLVYDMKMHTVAPYILHSKHMFQRLVIFMNTKNFNKLSKAHQDAIIKAAEEAGDWYSEQTFANFDVNYKKLEEEGATHIFADMSEWRERSMEAAWKMEAAGAWPKGTIQEVLLDTEPK